MTLKWRTGLGDYDPDCAGGLRPEVEEARDLPDYRTAEQEKHYRAIRWRRFVARIRMRGIKRWRYDARVK